MITEPKIEHYCIQHTSEPSPTLLQLAEVTQVKYPQAARMQVGPLEGRFLSWLASLARAQQVLEIGTFTGYSSLCFAEALPENGRVITLDIDPQATQTAKEIWSQSPHGSKIELRLGPALESLKQIQHEIDTAQLKPFDLVFIDADKTHYPHYYECALRLISPRGLILIDNVLWDGEILHPQDRAGEVIAQLNDQIRDDPRVEKLLLPIRDGVYLIRLAPTQAFTPR